MVEGGEAVEELQMEGGCGLAVQLVGVSFGGGHCVGILLVKEWRAVL